MPAIKHGSEFKWPVGVEKTIAAPSAEVWEAISGRGNLEHFHPFCLRNPVHDWPGPRSRDEVHYLNGLVLKRHFTDWIEGVGFDIDVEWTGDNRTKVEWRITPGDDRQCALKITLYPQVLQGWPVFLRWLPHTRWLRPNLARYLDSVLKGTEWYVTRKEPVPRNAFGTHPWFSAGG